MPNTRHTYDSLAGLYVPIAAGVVVVVFVLVVVFALRYRARDDGRSPSRRADAPWLERVYALVLALVAAVLLGFTFSAESKEDGLASKRPALEVRVTASKWHWRFDYPAYRITELGRDVSAPAATKPGALPVLTVPANEPVRFALTAVDVLHAFWIPEIRFKRDANPGRTDSFTVVFPRTGYFPSGGECSEFCGLDHAGMRFDVSVLAPGAFRAWARTRGGRR